MGRKWGPLYNAIREIVLNNGFHTDSIMTGACAISRKGADNKKTLKSHDFKVFYMVEISGIEPLT